MKDHGDGNDEILTWKTITEDEFNKGMFSWQTSGGKISHLIIYLSMSIF